MGVQHGAGLHSEAQVEHPRQPVDLGAGPAGMPLHQEMVQEGVVQADDSSSLEISLLQLGLAALLIIINAAVSFYFHLGLHLMLFVAAVRMAMQLTVLGYVLVPIITYNTWWLVLLFSGVMVVVASLEAVSCIRHTYRGLLQHTLLSLSSATGLVMTYCMLAVVQARPFYTPRYFVPLVGMLLGNTVSGVGAGLSAILDEFQSGRHDVEALLALGASRGEACMGLVQRALSASLSPLLSQMSVVGLVAMPGLMTGLLLQGADPVQASRYQVCIMFLTCGSTAIGTVVSVTLAALHLVDNNHMLRLDKMSPRRHAQGIPQYLLSHLALLGGVLARFATRLYLCCCVWRRPPARKVALLRQGLAGDNKYGMARGGPRGVLYTRASLTEDQPPAGPSVAPFASSGMPRPMSPDHYSDADPFSGGVSYAGTFVSLDQEVDAVSVTVGSASGGMLCSWDPGQTTPARRLV